MAFSNVSGLQSEALASQGIGSYVAPVYGAYFQQVFKSPLDPPTTLGVAIWSQTGTTGVNSFIFYAVNGDGTYTEITYKTTLTPANLLLEFSALDTSGFYAQMSEADYTGIVAELPV